MRQTNTSATATIDHKWVWLKKIAFATPKLLYPWNSLVINNVGTNFSICSRIHWWGISYGLRVIAIPKALTKK